MSDKSLILRTCNADLTSHNGFQWPESGLAEAPDWNPEPICGYGLHGLLWGEGDADHLNLDSDAKWLVVEVETSTLVDLNGKVKFPRGNVVHCGTKESATVYLVENGARGRKVVHATLTGGYGSTLTGGNGSTLTGGNRSTLTGGDGSTLTGGDDSTLTGGNGSTLTGGDDSTLTGGNRSTLTGGYGSTLTGGDGSTLTGGYGSTLTGGYGSTLTGGYGSTLTGGDGSTLVVRWWDQSARRYRVAAGEVGPDGLKPGVPYRIVKGEWIEQSKPNV